MSVGVAVITREGIAVAADTIGEIYEHEDFDNENGGVLPFKRPYVSLGGHHKMWAGERCAVVFCTSGSSMGDKLKEYFLRLASIQYEKVEPSHAVATLRPLLQNADPNVSISCLVVGYDSTEVGPIARAHMFTKPPGHGPKSNLREGQPAPMMGDKDNLENGSMAVVGQWEYLLRLSANLEWAGMSFPAMDLSKLGLQQAVDLCGLYIDHCARWQRLSQGFAKIGAPYDLCIMRPGEDAQYATLGEISDALTGGLRRINM